ncbi:AraC family transcriptional regulator [Cohnella endophytica]|uniref:AraC family transcriptional regulator n=1 Tax=Cohnella endophytica TaxID=2419778 RepID=A0A494XPN6_9BACL|nr:AraC family transcriptional regulator [Cohnella endophytica]RKP51671.1 AraC family transcriptional regulator [Cohnella endophytica]
MNLLEFTIPPLLSYITAGYTIFAEGDRHVSRRNIRVFDLLVVTKGCLYIGEEERLYEVNAGCALILRPDCYHYATEGCKETTEHYWVHFQTNGAWTATDTAPPRQHTEPYDAQTESQKFDTRSFPLGLPQFAKLPHPGKLEESLEQLVSLEPEAHLSASQFKQQLLFQEALRILATGLESGRTTPATACAEQAAAYLRSRYREPITAHTLGEALNFHPVYVARCMNKEYGSSPMEYLLRYRIEQSKLLLMQTDYTIARIAEEVGFNQAPYFSSCFLKFEGISPRQYRQRFSQG